MLYLENMKINEKELWNASPNDLMSTLSNIQKLVYLVIILYYLFIIQFS